MRSARSRLSAMGAAIAKLPGRKLILTNGSTDHADKVLARLGIGEQFEAVFDIIAAELEPKPAPQTAPVVVSNYGEPTLASINAAPSATPALTSATFSTTPPAATPVAMNTAAPAPDATGNGAGNGGGNGGRGGGGGFGGGFRFPRTFKGPGSASDVVVGKLAPGIARPPVFHQALPEKPATPQEGAYALFAQALFGSAEFRYLQ